MTDKRNRSFIFTINNYTEEDEYRVYELHLHASYVICGKEIGGKNGVPHLQGFVHFPTVKSLSQVSDLLPRARLESANGSAHSNFKYCTKEDGGKKDYYEFGVKPKSAQDKGQAQRDYWETQFNLVREGRYDELCPRYAVQNLGKAEFALLKIESKQWDITPLDGELPHQWYLGCAGRGKTSTALRNNPGAFFKPGNTKWWDQYRGQHTVIVDDVCPMSARAMTYYWKIWTDRFSFVAETKNGTLIIRPKLIIFTSQYHPTRIFRDDPETLEAMLRRFDIYDMDNEVKHPRITLPYVIRRPVEEYPLAPPPSEDPEEDWPTTSLPTEGP